MENSPSPTPTDAPGGVKPEVLQPRTDEGAPQEKIALPETKAPITGKRRRTYRPSHKATFIALAVVAVILAINAVVIGFVLKSKSKNNDQQTSQVTISSDVLDKIGVSKATIGDSGAQLTVGPNAQFNSKVTVAGDVTISGQFKLNNKLVAADAGIAKLEAGNTSLSQLDVNGTTTLTSLNLRQGLVATGASQLQGAVTVNGLLTVNSNLNVSGNVAIGGIFSASTFSANSLTSTSTLTIGGHIISSGLAPNVGPGGSALGSNGTVSISGTDSGGRISINVGVNANPSGGVLANVAFRNQYASVPRVIITFVVTNVNVGTCSFYVLNLTVGGFSVENTCGLPPGGFAIDYIAFQ